MKRYDLHFDLEEKRVNELLTNYNEYIKFVKKLKLKLSKDYKICTNKIIVTFPQKETFRVQVIFQSTRFNNLNLKEFMNNFKNDKDFEELRKLKQIHTDVILGACELSKNQLDSRGNRESGWDINKKRGNKDYYPPLGWKGIGLKVMDKYEDNEWIGMINSQEEWCVAYHGVGRNQSSEKVKHITGKIVKSKFKPGVNQVHEYHDDIFHKGEKVGQGVYCTPYVDIAENYAGISNINGEKYKTFLMVRVRPDSIRSCEDQKDYWVVDGTTDDIRPYRILYKKI